jgi:pimeloyl-ACP methyl ester carboxylesterase
VTFDGRGNGRSDRPADTAAYDDTEFVADAVAVLDHTGTDRAVLVALSRGAGYALRLAANHADRVLGVVFSGPAVSLHDPSPVPSYDFDAELDTDVGWAKWNAPYWRRDWPGFVEFFMDQLFNEPHSTKPIEDTVGWGLETDPETMIRTQEAVYLGTPRRAGSEQRRATVLDLAGQVRCPCLVVHGTADRIVPIASGERLAEVLSCPMVAMVGSGHMPGARDPVRFNLVVRDFVESVVPRPAERRVWVRPRERRPRALWISSPIGLGHVLRDLAIARAVRERVPDLQIDWWAQPPVTAVLEAEGETVHPVSTQMASESAHWESEANAHDLHAFQAYRRMDEIFVGNYMLFDDVVHDTHYDLWVGDESWEVDHFLHDNPERKIAPYVFTTDVIGFQPTNPDDLHEVALCADYNAEKINQNHWEQQHFVAHRLDRYRAGIRMNFATTSPADLSVAMTRALGSKPRYRRIRSGGAEQAAERIAALIRR